MNLKTNESAKELYRISPGTFILKLEMMLSEWEHWSLVFFFSFVRSLGIKKKKIPYEICQSMFFDIQPVLGIVNTTRVLSDLLTRA